MAEPITCGGCGDEFRERNPPGDWRDSYCKACRKTYFECENCGDVKELDELADGPDDEQVCNKCAFETAAESLQETVDELRGTEDIELVQKAEAFIKTLLPPPDGPAGN